jgi:hypothetical protein
MWFLAGERYIIWPQDVGLLFNQHGIRQKNTARLIQVNHCLGRLTKGPLLNLLHTEDSDFADWVSV